MNAKPSHFTSRLLLAAALVLAGGALQETAAQERYHRTLGENMWNQGRNVNGLRLNPSTGNASYAEMYGHARKGGFHASNESSSPFGFGVTAKTVTWSRKVSMAGSFSFSQEKGTDMDGSMFIHPGRYPVDVLEFTPGTKILQRYSFTGGMAADLTEHWKAGASISYESANYAKRKDIRHTNYALDIEVVPSIMYTSGAFCAGLSLPVRKTAESIQAEQIGSTADTYYAFLDKGLMYGILQSWDGSGVHLKETGVDRFPVSEYSLGAAAQLGWRKFYADIEFDLTRGVVGEKDYNWFKFPGKRISANAGVTIEGSAARHLVSLSCSWMLRQDYEYVMERVTTGGVTVPVTYGSNRVFEQRRLEAGPRYGMFSDKVVIEAQAGAVREKKLSTLRYPAVGEEDITLLQAAAKATFKAGRWRLGLLTSFSACPSGRDAILDSTTGTSTSEAPAGLFRLQEWYDLDHEWKTATRAGCGLSITRYLGLKGLDGIYIGAGGGFLKGFGTVHAAGDKLFGATARIGYEF